MLHTNPAPSPPPLQAVTFWAPCASAELLMLLKSRTRAPRGVHSQPSPSRTTTTILDLLSPPRVLLEAGQLHPQWSFGQDGNSASRRELLFLKEKGGRCVKCDKRGLISGFPLELFIDGSLPFSLLPPSPFPSFLPHTG